MTSILVEPTRRLLTYIYRLHACLPPSLRKQWQLATTVAFQLLPAVDPFDDPLLHEYALPATVRSLDTFSGREAVLITGGTGLVGLHLIDLLLRTTSRHLYVIVREKSHGKLQREAARYKLSLPDLQQRVTMLTGDCKKADLGLTPTQWAELAASLHAIFHLAANSSFIATYEVLRGEWMPSYVTLLEFCAAHGVGFHMVGSVGRFAGLPSNDRPMEDCTSHLAPRRLPR